MLLRRTVFQAQLITQPESLLLRVLGCFKRFLGILPSVPCV